MIPAKQLKRLVLDVIDSNHMEFTELLPEMPNLTDLFIYVTPDSVAHYHHCCKLSPEASASRGGSPSDKVSFLFNSSYWTY